MSEPYRQELLAAEWLRLHAFPHMPPRRAPRIGVEVELIALDAETHDVARYHGGAGPLGRLLSSHAQRHGWCCVTSSKGAPRWTLPYGGAVTLEPGGQIEYSTPPFEDVDALLRNLDETVSPLIRAAADCGITLLGAGIDPHNALDASPLQLDTERYRVMDAHFRARGEAGQRMMRQTAAVQLNVDVWYDASLTWRVLNAMAPCVLALSANSTTYAGRSTGCASYRAVTWRELDPTRTGLFAAHGDAALEYARFAIAAEPMVRDPFGAGWTDHLSTLFPEVRARGWFELRSADALPPHEYPKLILPVAAVIRDELALHEALELLGTPDPDLLDRAGRAGLADTTLRQRTRDLLDIAARAAARTRDAAAHADIIADIRALA